MVWVWGSRSKFGSWKTMSWHLNIVTIIAGNPGEPCSFVMQYGDGSRSNRKWNVSLQKAYLMKHVPPAMKLGEKQEWPCPSVCWWVCLSNVCTSVVHIFLSVIIWDIDWILVYDFVSVIQNEFDFRHVWTSVKTIMYGSSMDLNERVAYYRGSLKKVSKQKTKREKNVSPLNTNKIKRNHWL